MPHSEIPTIPVEDQDFVNAATAVLGLGDTAAAPEVSATAPQPELPPSVTTAVLALEAEHPIVATSERKARLLGRIGDMATGAVGVARKTYWDGLTHARNLATRYIPDQVTKERVGVGLRVLAFASSAAGVVLAAKYGIHTGGLEHHFAQGGGGTSLSADVGHHALASDQITLTDHVTTSPGVTEAHTVAAYEPAHDSGSQLVDQVTDTNVAPQPHLEIVHHGQNYVVEDYADAVKKAGGTSAEQIPGVAWTDVAHDAAPAIKHGELHWVTQHDGTRYLQVSHNMTVGDVDIKAGSTNSMDIERILAHDSSGTTVLAPDAGQTVSQTAQTHAGTTTPHQAGFGPTGANPELRPTEGAEATMPRPEPISGTAPNITPKEVQMAALGASAVGVAGAAVVAARSLGPRRESARARRRRRRNAHGPRAEFGQQAPPPRPQRERRGNGGAPEGDTDSFAALEDDANTDAFAALNTGANPRLWNAVPREETIGGSPTRPDRILPKDFFSEDPDDHDTGSHESATRVTNPNGFSALPESERYDPETEQRLGLHWTGNGYRLTPRQAGPSGDGELFDVSQDEYYRNVRPQTGPPKIPDLVQQSKAEGQVTGAYPILGDGTTLRPPRPPSVNFDSPAGQAQVEDEDAFTRR